VKRYGGPSAEPSFQEPLLGHIRGVLDGDVRAEAQLLEAVSPAMLRALRGVLGRKHADLGDVLQDAMLAFLDALKTFEYRASVTHFAARVAVMTALNHRRRLARRSRVTPLVPDDLLAEHADSRPSPLVSLNRARRCEAVRGLIVRLPEVQAEALTLHVILGYTVRETSAVMGVPLDTVRSRLRTAFSTLRAQVERDLSLQLLFREADNAEA